jgi:hypothetical protein
MTLIGELFQIAPDSRFRDADGNRQIASIEMAMLKKLVKDALATF